MSLTDAGLYRAEVTLQVAGLEPNGAYRALLGRGPCGQPSGESERLATLRADSSGRATGAGTLGRPLTELTAGAFHVAIRLPDSPAVPLVCSEITGRDLDYTINEFPAFSFLLGDLHPHVLALPFTLLALQVAFSWWLCPPTPRWSAWRRDRAEVGRLLVGAGLIGALYSLNSWDFPTYFVLAAVAMAGAMVRRTPTMRGAGAALVSVAATAVIAVVLFYPFYADFEPPASGLGLVPIRSRLDQFVVFWGLLLVPSVTFLATVFPWRSLGLTGSAVTAAKQSARPAPVAGRGRAAGTIWVAVFVVVTVLATVRGNGVLAVSSLLGLAAAWAIWAQRERPAVVFALVLARSRRRPDRSLRGGLRPRLLRCCAAPDEHRLQALLPGLDTARRGRCVWHLRDREQSVGGGAASPVCHLVIPARAGIYVSFHCSPSPAQQRWVSRWSRWGLSIQR